MIRYGKVISIDIANGSGLIIETRTKNEFFFTHHECKDEKLPILYQDVSFERDTDYKFYPIAIRVHPEAA